MRVGLISYNGQARDAIGNHLAEKLSFFAEGGADVRVFLQSADRLHPALTNHVHVVDRVRADGPVWDFLAGADLVLFELAQAYDLLHFLPLLAGGKPRLLLEYHGISPPQSWPGAQRRVLEEGLAKRGFVWCADQALVHSGFIRAELTRATAFPAERVHQLDFPLDDRFHSGPPRWSLRDQFALATAKVLLFVGRLAINKRVPVLIAAVARLREVFPPVHAVLVGDAGDLYAEEERRCHELARQLDIAERVHFTGSLDDERLADCYRAADVLVIPSVHEGFCVPIREAMACGLPVIAARTTALPETVGDAGLTFQPDDPEDLARQVRRVVAADAAGERIGVVSGSRERDAKTPGRVAVACFRFGTDIVGGAETSLRKIAHALQGRDLEVEVFTTCNRAEGDWSNSIRAGSGRENGLLVHRFPIDLHEREHHLESVRQIIEGDGQVSASVEQQYLEHSVHSTKMLAELAARIDAFAAVIVGPYLFGLTADVARAFPDKTLLLPCFHDEPLARLKTWPALYGCVGGILYHSPEEQALAQNVLGINHPRGREVATTLAAVPTPSPRPLPFPPKSYLVYCGRYSRQKDLPRLLEWMTRYQAARPFAIAFMGMGEVQIPKEDWARDLGQVDEPTKRAVLAGAAALVQLSLQESLSLVALEAWSEGTPIIVDRRCTVLAGQVERSSGGRAITDFDTFAAALDNLRANPDVWAEHGRLGRAYVARRYGSEAAFADRLLASIADLKTSLAEQMRLRGLEIAKGCTRSAWRQRFGQLIEQVLDAPARPLYVDACVTPVGTLSAVKTGTRTVLVSVRIDNRGTHALCADGPARHVLFCQVDDTAGPTITPLPGLLLPNKTQVAAALAAVPALPGEYRMRLWVDREEGRGNNARSAESTLIVDAVGSAGCTGPFLEAARQALVEADQRRTLPDDYVDVTEGWFAWGKRWLKQKLLGNFKRGYVDVLARQQSQVNAHLIMTLQQLTECCATFDHALAGLQTRLDQIEGRLAAGGTNRGESAGARAGVADREPTADDHSRTL